MAVVVLAPLLLLISGCGGGADVGNREAVSGEVTLDGAPLNDATIEFSPATPDVSSFTGTVIMDGKFSIPARKGLEPGTYKVIISASGATADVVPKMPGDPVPMAPELIPPKYNQDSNLTAEVKAGGENYFTFDLQR